MTAQLVHSQPERDSSPRRAEALFEHLALAILEGKYAAGSSLPSERELAARHHVSRGTVREAVHMLESAALARVSQGAPTIVLSHDDSLDVRVIGLRYRLEGSSEREQITERRVLQGLALTYLAERRAKPEVLDEILGTIDAFIARGSPEEEIDTIEQQVWTKIAQATNNRFLSREVAWWYRERVTRRVRLQRDNKPVPAEDSLPMAPRIAFYRELVRRMREGDRAASFYFDMLTILIPAK